MALAVLAVPFAFLLLLLLVLLLLLLLIFVGLPFLVAALALAPLSAGAERAREATRERKVKDGVEDDTATADSRTTKRKLRPQDHTM